jgi:dUTP pyrophosphatase
MKWIGTIAKIKKYKNERRKIRRKDMRFEKVSKENFISSINIPDSETLYEELKLPKRATKGSAGYDFYAPFDFSLPSGESVKIPTGIRAKMENGWVLMLFPRSGLGFKYRLQLDNTVGIIDADYYDSDNEGHIFIKLTNDGKKDLSVKKGEGFAQGIFLQYGVTEDDDARGIRNGGFGSTTK